MSIHKIAFAACMVGTITSAVMAYKEVLILLKGHKTN